MPILRAGKHQPRIVANIRQAFASYCSTASDESALDVGRRIAFQDVPLDSLMIVVRCQSEH